MSKPSKKPTQTPPPDIVHFDGEGKEKAVDVPKNQHSIPSAVRKEEAPQGEVKEEAPQEEVKVEAPQGEEDVKEEAAEIQPEGDQTPPAEQPPSVSQISDTQNIQTLRVDELAETRKRLAESEKRLVEYESKELSLVSVPPPPASVTLTQEDEANLNALLEMEAKSIEIGPDLDASATQAHEYGRMIDKCKRMSYAFAGRGVYFSYYRGEFFHRVWNQLAPKGQWMDWYTKNNFNKDEVARDLNIYKEIRDKNIPLASLKGMSANTVYQRIIKERNPKKKPTEEKKPQQHGPDEKNFLPPPPFPVKVSPTEPGQDAFELNPLGFVERLFEQAKMIARHPQLVRPPHIEMLKGIIRVLGNLTKSKPETKENSDGS